MNITERSAPLTRLKGKPSANVQMKEQSNLKCFRKKIINFSLKSHTHFNFTLCHVCADITRLIAMIENSSPS